MGSKSLGDSGGRRAAATAGSHYNGVVPGSCRGIARARLVADRFIEAVKVSQVRKVALQSDGWLFLWSPRKSHLLKMPVKGECFLDAQ